MNTTEAINTRRSIKHFDPDHQIPERDIRTLLELAMQSPTSFNLQHWRFVVITDPDLRQQIRSLAFDQHHMTEASALVLFTGDVKTWKKDPARYWRNTSQTVTDSMLGMIASFHEGREQLQRDEAMRSIGIAMQTLMLAAMEMGYQTCPTIGFEHESVAKLIRLPADHIIGPFVAIGKGIKPAWPKPGQLGYEEVVFHDRFPDWGQADQNATIPRLRAMTTA